MNKLLKYWVIGILFWVVVDFTTVFNPNFNKWLSFMPLVWVFYIGSPLLFAFLIYSLRWNNLKIFISTIVISLILEIIIFRNPLLYQFPALIIAVPLVIIIYSFINFTPKWIVDKKVKANNRKITFMAIVWIIISFLNFLTNIKNS